MSNTLLTNDIILRTALMEFENNLILGKLARRDYEKDFKNTTGSNIRIRKPTRYETRTGSTIAPQDINSQYTNITVGEMIGVDVVVTSTQLSLELDDFKREVMNPSMVSLANRVDSDLYNLTTSISNFVGTAGTRPNSFSVARDAAAILNSLGVPGGKDRFMLLESFDASALQTALYNSFNEKFNKEIILNGEMGNLAGFDCYEVQNAISPAIGTETSGLGTPAISGPGQIGTTLNLDGLTNGSVINAGRSFTIAGVYMLNPTSRNSTGKLAQFVVMQNAIVSGGAVSLTININDSGIVLTGPYRNVTNAPADNALVTFVDQANFNIAFHKEAFALVTVKMDESANGQGAFQRNLVNPKSKINIRMTRQYKIENDQHVIRFDILPAYKLFEQYACKMLGGAAAA